MSLFTSQTPSHPLRSLIILFAAWKTLLLTIALGAASSPAYDTSTNLLFSRLSSSNSNSTSTPLLAKQLTRWDALYFIHASHDAGKIYEQEYAFSTSLSSLLNRLSNLFSGDTSNTALFGILVAHLTHLISVLALYRLTYLIFSGNKNFAYVSSALHIVSPAGLFLSSPYAESPFSCLTFTGSYVFALSYATPCRIRRSLLIISAGGVFGLATWFRSNGLASGLLFAVALLQSLQSLVQAPKPSVLLEVLGSIVGGSLVAAGSVVPQYHAWQRFCLTASPRPWCEKLIPSIYTFVQEHYWNVGFLRYWTRNQIPLFLLASPMLSVLIFSGNHFLSSRVSDARFTSFVRTTAAIQTVVALLALTSYHVQIINRLSSGYFVWYWWIAGSLLETGGKTGGRAQGLVIFMVMYAAIQGALYSSFLPPA